MWLSSRGAISILQSRLIRPHLVGISSTRTLAQANALRQQENKMKDTSKILADLRALMKNLPDGQGSIAAYIIPSDDAHQSEYISEHDERRRFVSGFDGSAGTAVVTATEARLWTDGRYYLQAGKQLDTNWTLMRDGQTQTPTIGDWLAQQFPDGDQRIGVDAAIVSSRAWAPMSDALQESGNELVAVEGNLVDAIWTDQPKQTSKRIITLSTDVTGQTIGDKLAAIRTAMAERHAEVLVVTALDEVAWLLNMRGSDIDFNPVFFAYVIITPTATHFAVDPDKLPQNYQQHCLDNQVQLELMPYGLVKERLVNLIAASTKKVWIGLGSSYGLAALVPRKRLVQEISPIATMKALKNATEATGMRNCHIRDGVALCQYFAWLENKVLAGEYVDEISGATQLEEFRKKQSDFKGLSFPTISASGPNGSVIHYHPEIETNRPITTEEMYLCDSGAQYLDGTTDVTRTWHFGNPSDFERESFTRVLKGQMGLGMAIFPNKIKGQYLDTLARKSLWDVGLDYAHGTGHGIGHFLNVHEGPMGISYRVMPDDPGLQANMFVSNEPGFYQNGEFGIRIEDIVQIVPATDARFDFAGRGALTFYTVTMCPIQTKLIDVQLLSETERAYLNRYHSTVWATLSPLLQAIDDSSTLAWLQKETAAI